MSKPQRAERSPADAKKVMDDALRRMLATPPEPHVKKTKSKKAKKAAK